MYKKIDFFFLSLIVILLTRTLNMFALFLLMIMYSGAFWYTPPPQKPRTQFRFMESTSNNVTYDRDHLF